MESRPYTESFAQWIVRRCVTHFAGCARVTVLALLCALPALLGSSSAMAQTMLFPNTADEQPTTMPWWDDYPLITQADTLTSVTQYNSNVSFGGGYGDPTWGIYFQRANDNPEPDKPKPIILIHQAGLKCISYYEAFGQITELAAELRPKGSGDDYTPIYRSHWSWQFPDNGGPVRWVGPQNYFDNEDFAQPWTRTHTRYGGPQATYPDGTVATGYMNKYPAAAGSTDPASNPYNSRVLDAMSAKDILGNYQGAGEGNDAVNAINPGTGQPVGPIRGLVKGADTHAVQTGDNRYLSHISIGKDIVCPMWADFQRASVLYGVDHGLDGIWNDNYSAYDNFCFPPVYGAFGEWAVAKFRDYLKAHFTADQLTAWGVTDVNTFDVRTYLRAKMKALGGDDTQVTYQNTKWNDASWLDDPIWKAYKIYRRQTGTEGLTNYYNATKAAATQGGKPDFMVAGNDIPFYNLGWTRGNLDVVSAEMTPGWNFGSTTRGITLPPFGHFAPVYKLGREHAKSRLINLWMYADGAYSPSQHHGGIANVLQYEMLANSGLPLVYPSNGVVVGTTASNQAYFNFVASCKPDFAKRMPAADVGIFYSSSSTLYFVTPGSYADMNHQPHQLAYYGWGTALDELHYQYRAILEWKLTADLLKKLRVLIIPHADVLDKSDVTNLIEPWVKAGGLLLVTGNSGQRKGEANNFDIDPDGFSLAPLTGISATTSTTAHTLRTVGAGKVLYLGDNIGMNFFNNRDKTRDYDPRTTNKRALHLVDFSSAMDELLAGQSPVMLTTPDAPSTMAVNVFEEAHARRLFIDVNNYNIPVDADGTNVSAELTVPTPATTLTVRLPDWLKGVAKDQIRVRVLAPGTPPAATLELLDDGRAQISLGPVSFYASVVLDAPNISAARLQQYP